MKKIAFLFLILDNPNFPKIWDKYFRGHKDKYSIYIHPKYPEKTVWKKSNIISNLKETGWGFITRAYLELLKEAFKDPDNYKFVTISESCIPIQSFNQFYDAVTNDPRSWIKSMKISKYNYKARIDTQKTKPRPKIFLKNYARFCLNREHTDMLISKSKELEFFHKMHVGDEFFLSVLYPLKNVRDFAVTYDDWEYVKREGFKIKEEIRKLYELVEANKTGKTDKSKEIKELRNKFNNIMKNPKLITDVLPDLEQIKECKSYFYRKFSKDSNIEKYWKEIIDYHNKHPNKEI
jgi:hypothetical protein